MIEYKDISDYDYISFDIFDTLIFRNVNIPSDVFSCVEKIIGKKFKNKRICAEATARKNIEGEVTLDDIYNYLDIDNTEKIKLLEKSLEINLSTQNKELIDLYKKIEKDKKIIITSDMYLDIKTIKQILKKNGINNYYKIYLSSELKKTKSKGDIYDYILEDLKIDSQKIIHIGDNYKSDFINPQKYGIKAILYKRQKTDYNFHFKNSSIDNIVLNSFINNNCVNDDYYYNYGYECFGPILYGFSKSIIDYANNSSSKVFFLARDGYIVKKACEIIDYQNKVNKNYMFASRRSINVPLIVKTNNFNDLIVFFKIKSNEKITKFLKIIGVENYKTSKKFLNELTEEEKNELYKLAYKNSEFEYKNLKKYLTDIGFNSNLMIVDIGWYGSMQRSLQKMINDDITGYYMGLYTSGKNMYGYLFDNNKNIHVQKAIITMNSIFEFLFLAQHGSVKRFNGSKDIVEFLNYEYSESEKTISQKIQNGAIDFIKDFIASSSSEYVNLNPNILSENICSFALYPTKTDISKFENISFFNNGIEKILDYKGKKYYLFHLKTLYSDFKNTTWKSAFLKKLTGIYLYSYYLKWRYRK